MAFDINDRKTWAWIDGAQTGKEYQLNPDDPTSFYQVQAGSGRPYLHQCPIIDERTGEKQVFDPRLDACAFPRDVTEADVYDWAVTNGVVTDQR